MASRDNPYRQSDKEPNMTITVWLNRIVKKAKDSAIDILTDDNHTPPGTMPVGPEVATELSKAIDDLQNFKPNGEDPLIGANDIKIPISLAKEWIRRPSTFLDSLTYSQKVPEPLLMPQDF